MGLLNTAGYYDGLLGFLQSTINQGFLGEWQMSLIQSGTSPADLLQELVQAAGTSPAPRLDAL